MSVKVAIRVRPFNQRQKFLGCSTCVDMKNNTTVVYQSRGKDKKQHYFTFDYSFWSHDGFQQTQQGLLISTDNRYVDQKKVYQLLGEQILQNAWVGFNCCLFAYGQTGAGKSYSMIGYGKNKGIIPMACQQLFTRIKRFQRKGQRQYQVAISMLEIYNQKVQDLFISTNKRTVNGLKIRQNKALGVYVEGLNKFPVTCYAEIQKKMEEGSKNRSLASTLMNQYSSRAHTIVMIEFIQKQWITKNKMTKKSSLINLVDLAGSQRVSKTGVGDNKDRLKQASLINKSLHTLGRVIQSLAQQSVGKLKNIAIPYRESALTRILQNALGGNSKTTMICAISPANDNCQQTLSTLRYADKTKKIKNKPVVNQNQVDKLIRQLRQQNQRLKKLLEVSEQSSPSRGNLLSSSKQLQQQKQMKSNVRASMRQIQKEIKRNMQSFAINTENCIDQYQNQQSLLMNEFVDLEDPSMISQFQISFTSQTGKSQVFITNLNQDELLNFKVKYSCQNNLLITNKDYKKNNYNIQSQPIKKVILCGLGIQPNHAKITKQNDKYFIQTLSQLAAQYTLVNGKTVNKKQELFHNDRIILGTNSIFLFKNISNPEQRPNKKYLVQKSLGYEFAINQRQQQLQDQIILISNTSGSPLRKKSLIKSQNSSQDKLLLQKLQQIQNQFSKMIEENQRKTKQKQEKYKIKLYELQREKDMKDKQKEKLQEKLHEKKQQTYKLRIKEIQIQKLNKKLAMFEKQRQKRKKYAESILLQNYDNQQNNLQSSDYPKQFQQIDFGQQQQNKSTKKPVNSSSNTKKSAKKSMYQQDNVQNQFQQVFLQQYDENKSIQNTLGTTNELISYRNSLQQSFLLDNNYNIDDNDNDNDNEQNQLNNNNMKKNIKKKLQNNQINININKINSNKNNQIQQLEINKFSSQHKKSKQTINKYLNEIKNKISYFTKLYDITIYTQKVRNNNQNNQQQFNCEINGGYHFCKHCKKVINSNSNSYNSNNSNSHHINSNGYNFNDVNGINATQRIHEIHHYYNMEKEKQQKMKINTDKNNNYYSSNQQINTINTIKSDLTHEFQHYEHNQKEHNQKNIQQSIKKTSKTQQIAEQSKKKKKINQIIKQQNSNQQNVTVKKSQYSQFINQDENNQQMINNQQQQQQEQELQNFLQNKKKQQQQKQKSNKQNQKQLQRQIQEKNALIQQLIKDKYIKEKQNEELAEKYKYLVQKQQNEKRINQRIYQIKSETIYNLQNTQYNPNKIVQQSNQKRFNNNNQNIQIQQLNSQNPEFLKEKSQTFQSFTQTDPIQLQQSPTNFNSNPYSNPKPNSQYLNPNPNPSSKKLLHVDFDFSVSDIQETSHQHQHDQSAQQSLNLSALNSCKQIQLNSQIQLLKEKIKQLEKENQNQHINNNEENQQQNNKQQNQGNQYRKERIKKGKYDKDYIREDQQQENQNYINNQQYQQYNSRQSREKQKIAQSLRKKIKKYSKRDSIQQANQQLQKSPIKIKKLSQLPQQFSDKQFLRSRLKPSNSQLQKQLQSNLIICNNQNILTQRNLHLRKRKRQLQQLKKSLYKKQKIQLQKQLFTLIPMVQRFNLIAKQMNRLIQGKIQIQYRNFSHYEIIQALKNFMKSKYSKKANSGFSNLQIRIVIANLEEARIYKWPVEVFRNRFEIADELFQKFIESNQENTNFAHFNHNKAQIDKSKDPFWDPIDFIPSAVGYLSLECLLYGIEFEGEISFINNSKIIAKAYVILTPVKVKKRKTNHPSQQQKQSLQSSILHSNPTSQLQITTIQITNPRNLIESSIFFTFSIQSIEFSSSVSCAPPLKFQLSYEMVIDDYKTQSFSSPETDFRLFDQPHPINYLRRHSFNQISQSTLAYIADCPIKLSLNLMKDYSQECLNTSFNHDLQKSVNNDDTNSHMDRTMSQQIDISKIINNLDISYSGSALSSNEKIQKKYQNNQKITPNFTKKDKKNVIYENTQMMNKIDKQAEIQQKRRQEKRKKLYQQQEKLKRKKNQLNNNVNSVNGSGKKDDKDCTIY